MFTLDEKSIHIQKEVEMRESSCISSPWQIDPNGLIDSKTTKSVDQWKNKSLVRVIFWAKNRGEQRDVVSLVDWTICSCD